MKGLLILALTFAAGSAMAADMPIKAPPRAALVVDGWAGFYGGIQGGYNLGAFNPFCREGTCGDEATQINLKDNSPFVGGHLGFLVQNGAIVFGPEVGIQYWGFKSEAELVAATPPVVVEGDVVIPGTPAILLQQRIDWLFYANARLGISPFSGVLIYATGGAAWAHVKGTLINIADVNAAFEQSVLGWNVGAGVDLKLGASNWTLGAEYRYYDFGNVQAANPVVALIGIEPAKLKSNQLMGKLSYRFSSN